MNKSKLIEKIKLQLKELISNEVKFVEVKAGDLMISSPDEELVVGSEVFTIDTDGNNIPLSDGEYTLDSGVKIAVVAGKIEAMVTGEAEVEVEAEEEAPKEEENKDGEEEKALKEDDVMKILAKLEEKIDEMAKKFEEVEKEKELMKSEFAEIIGLPSTQSISVKPAEFTSVETKKSNAGRPDILSIREKIRAKR
jgi:hypothetical protein